MRFHSVRSGVYRKSQRFGLFICRWPFNHAFGNSSYRSCRLYLIYHSSSMSEYNRNVHNSTKEIHTQDILSLKHLRSAVSLLAYWSLLYLLGWQLFLVITFHKVDVLTSLILFQGANTGTSLCIFILQGYYACIFLLIFFIVLHFFASVKENFSVYVLL